MVARHHDDVGLEAQLGGLAAVHAVAGVGAGDHVVAIRYITFPLSPQLHPVWTLTGKSNV